MIYPFGITYLSPTIHNHVKNCHFFRVERRHVNIESLNLKYASLKDAHSFTCNPSPSKK